MEKDEMLKLDNQLCFLFYAISRSITRLYTPLLEPLGLTYPQYLVMLVLWEQDPQDVGSICKKLQLDTGTLTPLLKKLEAAGLLARARDPQDERRVIITLSAAGAALQKKARAIPLELLKESGLSHEEYLALMKQLAPLRQKISGQA